MDSADDQEDELAMKITKSQKIWGGALCLGLCALGLDQLGVFGSSASLPQIAATLAQAMEPAKPAEIVATKSADPVTSAFDHGIAMRLTALGAGLAPAGNERDGFAAPASWIVRQRVVETTLPDEQTIHFQQSHNLKAVVAGGVHSQAMVDDHLLLVGQSLDGFTLISLSQTRATFRNGNQTAELRLAGAEAAKVLEIPK